MCNLPCKTNRRAPQALKSDLDTNTSPVHHLFSLVWPLLLSLSLFIFLASSTSEVLIILQCRVPTCYSSCFTDDQGKRSPSSGIGCTMADALLLCCNSTPFHIFLGKIQPRGRPNSIVRFIGNQFSGYTDSVIFFFYSRYTVQSEFPSER